MPEQEYLIVDHLTTKELTRIFSKIVVTESSCWEWQAKRSRGGYGCINFRGRDEVAHRVLYAWAVEPLPRKVNGQKTPQLDHVACNNPPCCNPSHVKLVTPRENTLRSNNPMAVNARKTHCSNGHLLPAPNIKSRNGRYCYACRYERRASETPEQREYRRQQVAGYYQRRRDAADGKEWMDKRAASSRQWTQEMKAKALRTSMIEAFREALRE
jgi:hypothetical protein